MLGVGVSWWPPPFPWRNLSGGAGLGVLRLAKRGILVLWVWYAQIFKKYRGVYERIRLQEQQLLGIFPGQELPKTSY